MRIPAGWYSRPDGRTFFGRRFGDGSKGLGALVLTVLIGALSYGFRGAWVMFGLFVLVVGTIAIARGQVDWARLRSRGAGGLMLFAGLLITLVAGLARTPPADADDTAIVAPTVATSEIPAISTSSPAPSAVITSRATAPAGLAGPSRVRSRVGAVPIPSTYAPAAARRPAPARKPAPAPAPAPAPPRPAPAPVITPAPATTTPTRPAPTPSTTSTPTTSPTPAPASSTTTLPIPGTTSPPENSWDRSLQP